MNIVAEMSLYPLKEGPIPTIISFIESMRLQEGIEIVTNQLSTQVSGPFEAVTGAVNHCMKKVMETTYLSMLFLQIVNSEVE